MQMPAFSKVVSLDDSAHLNSGGVADFMQLFPGTLPRLSLEQLIERGDRSPTIVISFFAAKDDKAYTQRSRLRLNHVEFIDVFIKSSRSGFAHGDGQLHVSADDRLVAEALFVAEQKILQRITLATPEIDEDLYLRFNLVGTSTNFIKAMRAIKRVAQTESRVLIKGESGTGKEITARAVHHFSQRNTGPFVPINCGAFTDDMLLSELFGYKKGAFTGALEDRVGLIEHANGGTLFLDEIDSLSLHAQVSLLRFLQESEIRPIGGRNTKKINVRVIAASNKNLPGLVKSGAFREDLLYRLDVLTVTLPALRQRGNDLILISQHILSTISQEIKKEPKYLSLSVLEALQQNKWPGNFRELESSLLRAFLVTDESLIADASSLLSDPDFEELPHKLPLGSFSHEKNSLIRRFESEYIRKVLAQTSGNVTRAAEIAKKERRAFTRLMAKHGIHRAAYTKAS